MFKTDADVEFAELIIGLVIGLVIIAVIVYILCLLAMAIAGIAAVGGTLYGGGTAIGNYFSSFKENTIDNNRVAA